MTWKTFIDTFKNSGFINNTPGRIIMKLFDEAGCTTKFHEPAAKNWYYAQKPCPAYNYFREGKINGKKLYNFFKKRPDNKLEDLQQKFRETVDNNSPIDLETKDWDIFCWGLVNQFLDILGFQRIDITEILPDKKTVSGNQTSSNEAASDDQISDDENASDDQISDDENASGNQSSNDENVSDSQTSDSETMNDNQISDVESGNIGDEYIASANNKKNSINQDDSQNTFSGAQLAIPQDCKICLYCENWKGDAREALESTSGAYGRCIHLGKDLLSHKMKCEGFKENWGLITKYIISHHKSEC